MHYIVIEKSQVRISIGLADELTSQTIKQALDGISWQMADVPSGILLKVAKEDEHWVLEDCQDKYVWRLKQLGDLIYHLSDRLVFHIADKAKACFCVHAAAVTHQNKAIIIPAQSGSGKSSFTCWLLKQGFNYLTDELVLMQETGKMQAIARPIQIKAHGAHAVESLIETQNGVYYGERVNALSPASLGALIADQANVRLGMILFPKYQPEATFSFNALSQAEAGMQLMSNYVNARNHPEHGFRQMMGLVRTVPAYALHYGGFSQLPPDFVATIQQKLTQYKS